jgi:hypothetical protein
MTTNNTGWICARCQKSNAPHVNSCDCLPTTQTLPYVPNPFFPIYPQPIYPNPIYPWDPLVPYITTITTDCTIPIEEYVVPNIDLTYTVSGSQILTMDCLTHNNISIS